jgi:hypothetical protein
MLAPCVTSQLIASAVPPAAEIAATVSFSFSTLRATQATLAPQRASASAIARPNPRDAPVTSATCPARSVEIVGVLFDIAQISNLRFEI